MSADTVTNPTKLPGYGLPITASRVPESFPIALFDDDDRAPFLTVREYTMIEMMNRMSDKPSWEVKIFDDTTASKWKAELLAAPDMDVSEKMVDESIAELKYKAELFKTTNRIEALDGVFKSDTAISEDLRRALLEAVAPLENVPDDQKDWHPRSDDKVLDLVHPSIYPLVYGQTTIFRQGSITLEEWNQYFGVGDVLEAHQDIFNLKEWSNTFQWLPCDVDVSLDNSDEVKINSYINNLHPQKHRKLYAIIEQVIAQSIPLWNETLSKAGHAYEGHRKPRITLSHDGYGEHYEPEPQKAEDEGWGSFLERHDAWKDGRPILQPEPENFTPPGAKEEPSVDLRSDFGFADRKIQVIVKLASIYLTPSSPRYEGGSWHVEGAANENICASAIYYYESENISESLLSFRQLVENEDLEMKYEQGDHRALETIYGFENETARIQNLGSVVTRQSRLITFPNVMQHRVNPFHLEDPSRPGHRKILALFLVDPHQRIISTAHVPPQQAEWWEEHLRLSDQVHAHLPPELSDQVREHVHKPVSLEKAKQQRLELMDERSVFVQEHNDEYENSRDTFFLCEH